MTHTKYIFIIAVLAFVVTASPVVWAQPDYPPAQNCSMQLTLFNELSQPIIEVNPEVVLMFDADYSTLYVQYYDVRGFGSYAATVDGSSSLGRTVIMLGRYSNQGADLNRFLEVRFVSGPLRGFTYRLALYTINVTTNAVAGKWWDLTDPSVQYSLSGTTDCLVSTP